MKIISWSICTRSPRNSINPCEYWDCIMIATHHDLQRLVAGDTSINVHHLVNVVTEDTIVCLYIDQMLNVFCRRNSHHKNRKVILCRTLWASYGDLYLSLFRRHFNLVELLFSVAGDHVGVDIVVIQQPVFTLRLVIKEQNCQLLGKINIFNLLFASFWSIEIRSWCLIVT